MTTKAEINLQDQDSRPRHESWELQHYKRKTLNAPRLYRVWYTQFQYAQQHKYS